MSVDGKFKLDNPDDMKATMEITMTVGEWRRIGKDIDDVPNNKYPSTRTFRTLIRGLIRTAEQTFYEEKKEETET